MVLKEEKIYVLRDEMLRLEIIWLYHNILVVGHEEKWETIELVIKTISS